MTKQRAVRSVNFPKALYLVLRDQVESEKNMTNREQIRLAVGENIERVEELLIEAGLAKLEDEPHLVRLAIDKEIDEKLDQVAKRLGIDFSAVLLACLRRQYSVRIGDENAEKLQRKIKRARKKAEKDE